MEMCENNIRANMSYVKGKYLRLYNAYSS